MIRKKQNPGLQTFENVLVSFIDEVNPWKKRVHVHTVLQRNPRWNGSSQAERDVHGADGRWLWRGVAEREIVLKIPEHDCAGCDRIACYSGRVSELMVTAHGNG